jgi:hypothetical protein
MKVGIGSNNIQTINFGSVNFYVIDRVECIVSGNGDYDILKSNDINVKNYLYVETGYHESVGHWLYESAIFLPFYNNLKVIYPDLILYIPNMKKYKELFCSFLEVPFTTEFVEGSTIICPEPISCLTFREPNSVFNTIVDHFFDIFTPKPTDIKTNFLVMPRQSNENYIANNRFIDFSNIIDFLEKYRDCKLCLTDTINTLDDQITEVNESESIVLSSGGGYLVNSLLARNKTLYVIGEPDMLEQASKYPLFKYVMNKGISLNTVYFYKSDKDVMNSLQNHIFIFGDSHAQFSFSGLLLKHSNLSQSSFTMNRVGRDEIIPNYNPIQDSENSVFVFSFGEVDARCQIHKQLLGGRCIDEILTNLVKNYINSIKKNIIKSKKIIITAIIPPTRRYDYESIHGPIQHEFPFLGTDEERVTYTKLINDELKLMCMHNGFYFFDPYNIYKNPDGTLNHVYSDTLVHIGFGKNSDLLQSFMNLLYKEKLI